MGARLKALRLHLHRAIPVRWAHPLSVNARVVAWAAVEGLLSAPVLALLLCMVVPAALGEALCCLGLWGTSCDA